MSDKPFIASALLVGVLSLYVPMPVGTAATPPDETAGDSASVDEQYAELARMAEPLIAYSHVLEKLAEVVGPTVVHIEVRRLVGERWLEEAGSGVLVRLGEPRHTRVITSRHVVGETAPENVTIRLSDDRILHPVRVWSDEDTDVAVLGIDTDDVPVARLGDSDKVQVGHLVVALGSPFNHRGSLTQGIISAKNRRGLPLRGRGQRRLLNQNFLQTDAAINPGNSGGPLVNMRGEVIGINTAIASRGGGYQGVAFSMPINLVKRVADRLLSDGAVSRAFLGVDLEMNFSEQIAAQLGLERPHGALVAGIYTSTPADSAGLRERDVILQVDGIDIEDHSHLINVVSLTPVGKEVEVVVWRGRMREQIVLKVGDRRDFERRIGDEQRRRSQRLNELVREDAPTVKLESLGLHVRELDAEKAASAGFDTQIGGLLVMEVDPQGRAAGQVEPLDFIDQAERTAVTTPTAFQNLVRELDLSEGVLLRLQRISGSGAHTRVILVIP